MAYSCEEERGLRRAIKRESEVCPTLRHFHEDQVQLTMATSSILLILRTNIFTLTYAGPSVKSEKNNKVSSGEGLSG